jgi:hypothetical protein
MVTTLTFTCTVVGAVGVVLGAFCPLALAEDATVRQRSPVEKIATLEGCRDLRERAHPDAREESLIRHSISRRFDGRAQWLDEKSSLWATCHRR